MSSEFSNHVVITQDEHDKGRPSKASRRGKKRTGSARRSRKVQITQEDHDSSCSDQDESPSTSSKSQSSLSNKPKWNKRRKRDDVLATQLRVKVAKMKQNRTNRLSAFGVDCQVWTIHPDIAPLSKEVPPGKARRVRVPLFGTIVKQSEHYPRFWLVNFYDGRSLYVTLDVLKLKSKASPSFRFVRGQNNMLETKRIDKRIKNDKEIILTNILQSNADVPEDQHTYEDAYNIFKPHYNWLTTNLLKDHVFILRQKLEVKQGTWLQVLPDPFPMPTSSETKDWLDGLAETSSVAITPSKFEYNIYHDNDNNRILISNPFSIMFHSRS